jgi:hypothetical protein
MKIHRTHYRWWVEEKDIIEQAMKELGSGIKLKPEIAEKLRKTLDKITQAEEEDEAR